MIVRFDVGAEDELDAAVEFYDEQCAGLGIEFLIEFRSAVDRIVEFPHAWPLHIRGLRQCALKRFPYGIIYHEMNDAITIVAIAHLHREYGYWRDRS